MKGREPLQIERHAHLRFRRAPYLGLLDAAGPLKHVAQVARGRFQLARRRGFTDQRQNHHVRVGRVGLESAHVHNARRKIWPRYVQLTDEFIKLALRIRPIGKFHRDAAHTRSRTRPDFLDIFNPVEGLLKRHNDQLLDLLGIGARQHDRDARQRKTDGRIFGLWNGHHRAGAEGNQHGEKHQRELPAVDEKSDDVLHKAQGLSAMTTASPSRT